MFQVIVRPWAEVGSPGDQMSHHYQLSKLIKYLKSQTPKSQESELKDLVDQFANNLEGGTRMN